jgi:hypothetical protein
MNVPRNPDDGRAAIAMADLAGAMQKNPQKI